VAFFKFTSGTCGVKSDFGSKRVFFWRRLLIELGVLLDEFDKVVKVPRRFTFLVVRHFARISAASAQVGCAPVTKLTRFGVFTRGRFLFFAVVNHAALPAVLLHSHRASLAVGAVRQVAQKVDAFFFLASAVVVQRNL